jgi:hypothetical protein
MICMVTSQIANLLVELRSNRDAAAKQVYEYEVKLEKAKVEVGRYNAAIESLELLDAPTELPATPSTSVTGLEAPSNRETRRTTAPFPDAVVAETRRKDMPARIAPYAPIGGKRLKSKLMVFDLLKKIGQPVPRHQLCSQFFEYYGRDDLAKLWQRPDNALNTAIDRARDEGLLLEIKSPDGGPALYTVGWEDSETGKPAMYSGEGG